MTDAIDTSEVTVGDGLPIFLAVPKGKGPFPVVVVLHERYGLVAHTMDLARRLAELGYVVGAPDLYFQHPDQDALHRGEARIGRPSDRAMLRFLCDTVDSLRTRAEADGERVGMIGACATGRYPIVYGAHRPLQAAVVLHGAAPEKEWEVNDSFPESMPSMIERLSAPMLGMFGEKDHGISIDDVRRFRDLFERYDKSYEISIYEGAPHGWMNDTMPGRYRSGTATSSWQQLVDFLDRNLKDDPPVADVSWRFRSVKSRDYDFATNVRFE